MRDEDMIEALYLKNKIYLGLPSATSTDFTAIMADYYCCLEQSSRVKDEETIRLQQQDIFDEDFNSILNSPLKQGSSLSKLDDDYLARKRARTRYFESPRTAQALRKLQRKPEYEILSQPIDFEVPSPNRRKDQSNSQRGLFSFVYSPQVYLNDFAQQVSSLYPVSPKVMFWCRCEWFYSYVDRGFFCHNEFEKCLNVVLKGFIDDLPLREWRAIKALMGKPRRFSSAFVHGERQRLYKYREAIKVLQQGKVLPSNFHDMLPYINMNLGNVSSRLMVGQRVLAVHPKIGQVKSGNILTLDSNRYHVQFDAPELGVCFISDTQLVPIYTGEEPKVEAQLYSIPERPVSRDRFKAGVNIYAMSFILKLLERKEALLELLKTFNNECSDHMRKDPSWRPDSDFQQQYAWIGVCIQAINMAIAPVLDVFRLRAQPPSEPVSVRPFELVSKQSSHLDQLRAAANALLNEKEEELQNKNLNLQETQRMQDFLKKSLMLMFALEQFKKEKSEKGWSNVQEILEELTPACESNKRRYDQLVATVGSLESTIR
mmetsp:Transcript_13751/g.25943  ORF Transcript_13751/g.25943 Transcript_13751/m.25943 type:complete len:544 (-) Transcript_13751:840-2471(-)